MSNSKLLCTKQIIRRILPAYGLQNADSRDLWVKNILCMLPANSTILDAGAGEQRYKEYCNHLRYTSQDFCQYDGRGNNDSLQSGKWDTSKIDIISDIVNIPVNQSSYDFVLCTEVLEHLPYPIEALKEFNRVLKPGGQLILTAPFASLTHMAPYFYYSGFSKYFYQKILIENGFKIVEISPNGSYFEYMAQEIRRWKYMVSQYSSFNFYSFVVIFLGALLLLVFPKFSKHVKNTSNVLCFGYHVLAQKI